MTREPVGRASSVTIVDVARAAGVSHSTVSRVLNGFPHIKAETRTRVEAAVRDLGYVANLSARGLAGGRLGLVGLVVLDLALSYNVQVVRGVDAAVAEAGLDLMLCTTHEREQREHDYVQRLSVGLCDGLIVVLPTSAERYIADLNARQYPFVLVDHDGSGQASSVVSRNEEGGFEAVSHLASLGHRRIGCITGDLSTSAGRDRLAGWRRAVDSLHLDGDPALVFEGDFRSPAGEVGARQLLGLASPPTAIFACSDATALDALKAAHDMGVSIPDELSLIGFDDIPEAAHTSPPLTTRSQPMDEMGREAVRLLLARMDNPERPVAHVQLETHLVERASTAPPV